MIILPTYVSTAIFAISLITTWINIYAGTYLVLLNSSIFTGLLCALSAVGYVVGSSINSPPEVCTGQFPSVSYLIMVSRLIFVAVYFYPKKLSMHNLEKKEIVAHFLFIFSFACLAAIRLKWFIFMRKNNLQKATEKVNFYPSFCTSFLYKYGTYYSIIISVLLFTVIRPNMLKSGLVFILTFPIMLYLLCGVWDEYFIFIHSQLSIGVLLSMLIICNILRIHYSSSDISINAALGIEPTNTFTNCSKYVNVSKALKNAFIDGFLLLVSIILYQFTLTKDFIILSERVSFQSIFESLKEQYSSMKTLHARKRKISGCFAQNKILLLFLLMEVVFLLEIFTYYSSFFVAHYFDLLIKYNPMPADIVCLRLPSLT